MKQMRYLKKKECRFFLVTLMIYVDLQCSYYVIFVNFGFRCFNLVMNLVTGAYGVGYGQYVRCRIWDIRSLRSTYLCSSSPVDTSWV